MAEGFGYCSTMVPEDERHTEDGFRRLIAFSDAVVAIALTLLVLPLADIVTDIHEDVSVWEVFGEHQSAIGSFLLSFLVIWVLWHHHHRIMENFRAYDSMLFTLTFIWLLTIVVLPFATSLIDSPHVERSNVFYVGVLGISMLALTTTSWWGMRHRQLLVDGPDVQTWVVHGPRIGSAIAIAVAFLVVVVFPSAGEWPLLLLFLGGPIEWALSRRRASR